MGKIKFKVEGVGDMCVPPVLTVTTIAPWTYELTWNYNGVDYSVTDPTTRIYVQVSIGASGSFQNVIDFPYTTQTYTYDDSVESNKILYFRLLLINTKCEIYSNRVGITTP